MTQYLKKHSGKAFYALPHADFSASGSWYTEEDNAANIQNGSVSCGGADDFSTLYTYANRSNSNATTNYVKTFTQKYGETQLLKYYYTFDERGNISHISESDNQSNSFESFEYDFLNQLYIVVDKRNQTYMHFSYDDGGNITQVVKSNYDISSNQPSTQIYCNTYTYDSVWKDKLVSFNNQAITYDAMGNPLQYRDGLSFTWKNGRQLATVTQNNETLAMTYDCNGLRTQKGGTHYYYDSENNLIAMSDGTHTLFFYYDENGNATSFSLGGNMYFYVKNLQGDIINIVDENGSVVVRYDYDVLGKITAVKNGSNQTITDPASLAFLNPLRYRGYVCDDETGLYYLQSRYYDPVTGRFLNADVYVDTETGTPLSTNMFAYCENSSLISIDSNGQRRKAYWNGEYSTPGRTIYNCYAYALGINNLWLEPGGRGNDYNIVKSEIKKNNSYYLAIMGKPVMLPKTYSVDYILEQTKKDLRHLRIPYRQVYSSAVILQKGEYLIAIRTHYYKNIYNKKYAYFDYCDFHFMKQDPKTLQWWHKISGGNIQNKGRINPDFWTAWYKYEDMKGNPMYLSKYYMVYTDIYTRKTFIVHYNSITRYLVIKKEFTKW